MSDEYGKPDQVPVWEAIRRVKHDVGAVGKEGRMSAGAGGNYNFRQIDAMIDATAPAMIRHGLLLAPVVLEHETATLETARGSKQRWVRLKVRWVVMGPCGDTLEPAPEVEAEALDTSDKATSKAHTAAYKVALAQILHLPFSANPDQDDDRQELGGHVRQASAPPAWTAAQLAEAERIEERIDGLPAETAFKLITYVAGKAGIEATHVADLPPSWLDFWSQALVKAERAAMAVATLPQATDTGEPKRQAARRPSQAELDETIKTAVEEAVVDGPMFTHDEVEAMDKPTLVTKLNESGLSTAGSLAALRARLLGEPF